MMNWLTLMSHYLFVLLSDVLLTTIQFKEEEKIFMYIFYNHAVEFSKNQPLGQFFHKVAMSVCLYIFLSVCPLYMLTFLRPLIGPQVTTILWLQQTARLSCWSSMVKGIWPVPTNKWFNSAYLENKFLISGKKYSNTFWLDETFSC